VADPETLQPEILIFAIQDRTLDQLAQHRLTPSQIRVIIGTSGERLLSSSPDKGNLPSTLTEDFIHDSTHSFSLCFRQQRLHCKL